MKDPRLRPSSALAFRSLRRVAAGLGVVLWGVVLCAAGSPAVAQESAAQGAPAEPPVETRIEPPAPAPSPLAAAAERARRAREERATVRGTFSVPAMVTADGPLFALEPLVERLGGELTTGPAGEGRLLVIDEHRVLFGPGNRVALIDGEPLRMGAEPLATPSGIHVPIDLLQATFGDFLGYRFDWRPDTQALSVARQGARRIPVGIDVVNLRGLTTVVLQFPERPRYRVEERPGGVTVLLLGDRLEPSDWRMVDRDPLVRDIRLETDRILVDLASGTGVDRYELADPFRLVLDVHRAAAPTREVPLTVEPPRDTPGIHTIVLDPGHGGENVGAVGPSGAQEKSITLLLARALKSRLERRMPVRVLLTRNDDSDVPHDARTAFANQNKADLFLSLHLNSETGNQARGAETFFLSLQASDARAARSAAFENEAAENAAAGNGADAAPAPSDEGDPLYDLQLILWDLAQSQHLAESQRLAALIQEELNGALGLRDRGVKQAPFRVLMGAAMPAVLVELGFISNSEEEKRLRDAAYRAELVDAVARAVERFRAQVGGARGDGGEAEDLGARTGTGPGAGR